MKKLIIILVSSVLFLLLISCTAGESAGKSPYGSYIYRSYNFLGDLVGDGTIYVNEADSGKVTGNWSIRQIRSCPDCGKQFGSGYLEGYIENDSMFVNLNPTDVEINTMLIGKIKDGKFSGIWRWTDIQNFGFEGTFEATRD
ncbi:hypothetical protein BMS3Abin03_02398 [bacterium BMS3Abin03]|nr:hypothetical protein BMS3Abin03_02398 [bacterium BMS3Abin03]HDZ59050.1 hypothetical protein [Ignavibacteriales bacterium]